MEDAISINEHDFHRQLRMGIWLLNLVLVARSNHLPQGQRLPTCPSFQSFPCIPINSTTLGQNLSSQWGPRSCLNTRRSELHLITPALV